VKRLLGALVTIALSTLGGVAPSKGALVWTIADGKRNLVVGILAMMAITCQSGSQSGWQVGSKPVGENVVSTFAGAQHCQMQNSTFLVMGWPLGREERNPDAARWFVRNPPPLIKEELLNDFGANVTPPKDARYTNYHNSTFELWFAPSDQDLGAYVKTGGHFERWPRVKQSLMCL
jgi:hypothetical protein